MGFVCVDDVCCNSACDGTCRICNDPSALGVCIFVRQGTDPLEDCEEDQDTYFGEMKDLSKLELDENGQPKFSNKNTNYYLNIWRTFQMSDHLPMWVELKIDFAEQYLRELLVPSYSVSAPHPLSFSMPELEQF